MKKFCLAPLAGITDWPFRQLCFEQECDSAYTEMVSATGYVFAPMAAATQRLLQRSEHDRRLIVQLFGKVPDQFEHTVRALCAAGIYDGIDINMGCPVHKVAGSGEGSGLMRTPDLARQIMTAAVRASSLPVSVKMRLGWKSDQMNYLDFCKMAEDCGISSITIHGRTREQMYSGEADWEKIYEGAQSVSIPVYGNGDIFSAECALKRVHDGPVAGVLIARGALGNPWIFGQIKDLLAGREMRKPSLQERMMTAMRHLDLQLSWKPERVAVSEMRKHISWYLHGVRGAASIRDRVNRMESQMEVRQLLEEIAAHGEESW